MPRGARCRSEGQHDAALDSLQKARTLLATRLRRRRRNGGDGNEIHFSRAAATNREITLEDAVVAQEQLLGLIEAQEGKEGPLTCSSSTN